MAVLEKVLRYGFLLLVCGRLIPRSPAAEKWNTVSSFGGNLFEVLVEHCYKFLVVSDGVSCSKNILRHRIMLPSSHVTVAGRTTEKEGQDRELTSSRTEGCRDLRLFFHREGSVRIGN